MDEWITLTEYNWAFWVAGLFALIEFAKWSIEIGTNVYEWLFTKKGIETKRMREAREWHDRLKKAEKDIEEIKDTSKKNIEQFENMKNEIVTELNKLHEKFEKTNKANNKTDCAMLRDRIGSGMRYFSKNVGPDGKVHISLSDYENMNALFQEYFIKHGNGAFKKMYDDEFVHFIIDR